MPRPAPSAAPSMSPGMSAVTKLFERPDDYDAKLRVQGRERDSPATLGGAAETARMSVRFSGIRQAGSRRRQAAAVRRAQGLRLAGQSRPALPRRSVG